MELKQAWFDMWTKLSISFNRTFMELKLFLNDNIGISASFNRTFMELKLGTAMVMPFSDLF